MTPPSGIDAPVDQDAPAAGHPLESAKPASDQPASDRPASDPAAVARATGLTRPIKTLLFCCLLAAGIGQSFIFAVLPPLGREMGLIEVEIAIIIMAAAVLFTLGAPVWGWVSEYTGRRPIIVFGLIVFGLTTAGLGVAVDQRLAGAIGASTVFWLMVALRAGFAAGGSGLFPSIQALIADRSPPERRTAELSLIAMAFGTGMVIGPGAAGMLASIGLTTPFYGIGVFVLCLSVIAFFMLRTIAPRPRRQTAHERAHPPPGIAILRLTPLFVTATCTMTTLGTIQQVTGFRVQDVFGLTTEETAQQASIALMAMAGALLFVQLAVVSRLGWSSVRLLRTGAPLAGLGVAVMMAADSLYVLAPAMAAFGGGLGMMMPGFFGAASIAAGPHQQGRVAGLMASFQGLGFIIGPVGSAALYQWQPQASYAMALCLVAIVSAIAYLVPIPGPSDRR